MEWLSYSLSDFLMFGPEVYLRLFVRINQDAWPWQCLALAVVVAIAVLLVRGDTLARRGILLLVAVAWVCSGAGFLMEYYGPINTPATYFGWVFLLQGAVLTVVALVWRWEPAESGGMTGRWPAALGWLVLMASAPWLAVIQAGEWRAIALFGITPDVTVVGAVACLWLLPRSVRWLFLLVPLVWSLFSAATLWTLGTVALFVVPAAALVLTAASFFINPRPGRSPG